MTIVKRIAIFAQIRSTLDHVTIRESKQFYLAFWDILRNSSDHFCPFLEAKWQKWENGYIVLVKT